MAGSELAGQLAILEEALQRLEEELARKPAWRALQADVDLDDTARAQLTQALQDDPVYRAWTNMRDAAAIVQRRQAGLDAAPASAPDAAPSPASMTTTLAHALQQLPPDDADAEMQPEEEPDVARVLAAEVAAQTMPAAPDLPPDAPVLLTAEDREAYDVGHRATQAVERILAIPVIEPIAPRAAAPSSASPQPSEPPPAPEPAPGPAQPAEARRDPTDEIGHAVPLEAEDLAFLLTPATRPASGDQRPFLKRLVAEAQAAPTKATVLPTTDPFMVPPAGPPPVPETPAAAPPPETAPDAPAEAERKPRLARLLKAWSRH